MPRRFATAATLALLPVTLLVGTWALAQTAPTLNLEPNTAVPGDTVVATGEGWVGVTVAEFHWIALDGEVLAEVAPDSTGSFTVEFTVPAAGPGVYSVFACGISSSPLGGGCSPQAEATLTVTEPPPETTTTTTTTVAVFGADVHGGGIDDLTAAGLFPPPPVPIPPKGFGVPTTVPPPPDDLAEPIPEDFPDLVAVRLEVTQGMQNLANEMPLVANRRTFVRVYVDVVGKSTWPASGAIEVSRGGQVLGYRWPQGGAIIAKAGGGDRVNLDDSLYFALDDAWVDGTVKIRTFIYSFNKDTPFTHEPWSFNNFNEETVDFHEAQPVYLHLVPSHLHRSYHPSDVPRVYWPDFAQDLDIVLGPSNTMLSLNGMYRYHPISDMYIETETSSLYRFPLLHGLTEWDLGPCRVTLDGWESPAPGSAVVDLPSVDDFWIDGAPDDLGPVLETPDRTALQALDRVVFNVQIRDVDGVLQAVGTDNEKGPQPLPLTPTFVLGQLCWEDGIDYHRINKQLALFRIFEDWDEEREFFVALVHPTLPRPFGGIALIGKDSTTVGLSNSFGSASPWVHSGAATVGHETVHLTGLDHTPCADADDDGVPDELDGGPIDETHPANATFPDCSLAPVDEAGWMGFDVAYTRFGLPEPTVISNDPAVSAPNLAFPVLAYVGPGWTDPYNWCLLLDYYGVPCAPEDIGLPAVSLAQSADEVPDDLAKVQKVAILGGRFENGALVAEISESMGVDTTPALIEKLVAGRELPGYDYDPSNRLVALDEAGRELYATRIVTQSSHHDVPLSVMPWSVYAPVDGVAAYRLEGPEGELLDEMAVSMHDPEIEFESTPGSNLVAAVESGGVTFTWTMADADGDDLLATLLYSPNGERWEAVTPPAPVESVTLDTIRGLPGSDHGVFRVSVSDGIRSTSADSGPYEIPNSPPTVTIQEPLSGSAFPVGAEITLAGTGFDLEDRSVARFAWSSSINGDLGEGASLRIRGLSPGTHGITLQAWDLQGATATALADITVEASIRQVLPGDEWVAAMIGVFAAGPDDAPGAASSPTTVAATTDSPTTTKPRDGPGAAPDASRDSGRSGTGVGVAIAVTALLIATGVAGIAIRRRRQRGGADL